MKLVDRQDLFAPQWAPDGMSAKLPAFLDLGVYRIHRALPGYYRVRRGQERSRKMYSIDECRRFVECDARSEVLKLSQRADAELWLPMWAANRDGWAILAKVRDDVGSMMKDDRYAAWAGQQIVIVHAQGEIPETDAWDMAAPVGASRIPGSWFAGWRPLAVPLPPRRIEATEAKNPAKTRPVPKPATAPGAIAA
ncbi:hypothetical protein GE300_14850 [Rhodobacteraceae bacterium 2CG4]|uniref:Uncharacterized protein n=1 Tax=Halovulum marinum TaxID=2662447 RepID=A0A6L5Z2W0_9RHOB|nr:hypothetical protein [Halovulum marinum]MSU90878.1 hypothetical protein [Halovulum marinum]